MTDSDIESILDRLPVFVREPSIRQVSEVKNIDDSKPLIRVHEVAEITLSGPMPESTSLYYVGGVCRTYWLALSRNKTTNEAGEDCLMKPFYVDERSVKNYKVLQEKPEASS